MEKNTEKMYQVSTLQALALGYSRMVVTVSELMQHGDIGLGTFEDVNGEMIVLDGECYRADDKGVIHKAEDEMGVPFSSVAFLGADKTCELDSMSDIDELKQFLDLKIEEDFGLNSMHIVRIDGSFKKISARSGSGNRAHHVTLKETLDAKQKSFCF